MMLFSYYTEYSTQCSSTSLGCLTVKSFSSQKV